MSVISDIKMILESNKYYLLHDAKTYYEQKGRWDAIKDADLVEVVRCKDCKYEDTCCRTIRNEKKPTDFCSYGERREDE